MKEAISFPKLLLSRLHRKEAVDHISRPSIQSDFRILATKFKVLFVCIRKRPALVQIESLINHPSDWLSFLVIKGNRKCESRHS